jgi:pyruvate dehydrogenase E1 component alpha subunit
MPRLLAQLRMMLLIRFAEERIGDGVTAGEIRTPCHLGIGQEAIAVGVSEHLRRSDRVFGAHRSHSHYLAMGGGLYELLAEILGRDTGCSRGMGGSMHLWGGEIGFLGSVPIVAGTVPLAVGAALAAKKDGRGDIAVAYFGDGAAEEGVVHESLNLAAAWRLPVLFVCENNLFSSHLHISLRQPGSRVARYADAHGISADTVDGNDVLAVSSATKACIEAMRNAEGPRFLEAVTYRWRGHVGPREDNDVGVNRGSDLVLWKARDPVRRLAGGLMQAGALDAGRFAEIEREVRQEVDEAWRRAGEAPYPPPSALLDRVYAKGLGNV